MPVPSGHGSEPRAGGGGGAGAEGKPGQAGVPHPPTSGWPRAGLPPPARSPSSEESKSEIAKYGNCGRGQSRLRKSAGAVSGASSQERAQTCQSPAERQQEGGNVVCGAQMAPTPRVSLALNPDPVFASCKSPWSSSCARVRCAPK